MKGSKYMPPDLPIPGCPEGWIRYAMSDIGVAQQEPEGNVLRETLCFHAQQAVEKALKAVLIHHGRVIPKTHNIATLLTLLVEVVPALPPEVLAAAALTDYAVGMLYPGAWDPVTAEEHANAVEIGQQVISWACARISVSDQK